MVITSVVLCGEFSLGVVCAAEFPAPHDEGVFEESTLLEVL
jgi:hypothetical protein